MVVTRDHRYIQPLVLPAHPFRLQLQNGRDVSRQNGSTVSCSPVQSSLKDAFMSVISGDGVFSHATVGSSDLAASTAFYDAALAPLGVKNLGPFGDACFLYGKDKPALLVLKPGNGGAPSSNGVTIGFAAATSSAVDAFHAAGLAAGGKDEGAAGPRGHLPGAYAAYLRDPAGNKVCAYTFV